MRNWLFILCCLTQTSIGYTQASAWKFQPQLDSLLATKSLGQDAPGFAVCILEKGQIVYEYQSGLANLELKKPIRANTQFNIGSVAKQFTATCIFLLEEQGKLRRSDSIQKYIPELPDFGRTITLDHLISHTSGMFSHVEALNFRTLYKNRFLEPAFIFSFYQKWPAFSFQPGTDFSYNNTAYMLLAMVVERVSGMKTGDFMQKNIFQPLGMNHTQFCLIEADGLTDGTVSYTYLEGKKRYKKENKTHNMLGATGIHCSLQDLALWQLNFEHNRLGKGDPNLIRQLESSYTLNDGTSVHYGAGLVIKNYRGIPTVEHGGGWNSFLLQSRRFPEQGISMLVASNNERSNPFPIADAICDKLLEFKPLPEKSASNLNLLKLPAQNLEGKYLSFNNRLRHIIIEADTLKVRLDESASKRTIALRFDPNSSSDTLLTFLDPTRLYPLQFLLDKKGQVRGFFWNGGDYFECRRYFEKLDETPIPAKKWTGKYKGDGFKQNIHIRRKGKAGVLKLKPKFFLSYRLEPITSSIFRIKGERTIVRFTKQGFVLGDDWTSNLRFLKN